VFGIWWVVVLILDDFDRGYWVLGRRRSFLFALLLVYL